MKKYIQGKLYLQISDIFYLINHGTLLSDEIYNCLLIYSFNIDDNFDITEFVCFGSNCMIGEKNYICIPKDDILYLNSLPCIINYDSYKDYSIENITNECNNLACKIKQLELRYNNISDNIIKDILNDKHDNAVHKLQDLKILKLFKEGKLKLDIPEGNSKIKCIYNSKRDN